MMTSVLSLFNWRKLFHIQTWFWSNGVGSDPAGWFLSSRVVLIQNRIWFLFSTVVLVQ